jgi:serine/threonine-protein phosphatase 4 regulatory subunit 1
MYENAIEDDVDEEEPVEPSITDPSYASDEVPFAGASEAYGSTDRTETPHPALTGGLVDEGDLLPSNVSPQIEADVTFDDEGLTTLERIFLLCRSEYSFHRAYAARVLGELLGDVDPCESVEYVLPLVSGFSLDEDESVKEAFAADLHRILWYFFSTCQVVVGDDSGQYEATVASQGDDNLSRSSTNLPESVYHLDHVIRTPGSEMPRDKFEAMFASAAAQSGSGFEAHVAATQQATDGGSGPEESPAITEDTTSGTHTTGTTRSASHVTDPGTAPTSVSLAHYDDGEGSKPPMFTADSDKHWHSEYETIEAPAINVDFFRPMLGTLLLSHNPAVADPVRAGIVAIISRLRGHGPVTTETWGSMSELEDEDRLKTFLSQTGPHAHAIRAFDSSAKALVEQELLQGIVLGMGTLSTEVPESLFDNSVEVVGDDDEEYTIDRTRDEELFRQQMIHEAALGRALSLSLIGSVSEMYSACEVEQYGFVDEVIRGLDGDRNTRAEAAVAMAAVIKAAPEASIDRLLPVFELYANDEDDQVRQAACVCLAPLCKRIPLDTARRHFAVQAMTTFMASGDNVRYGALEVLGEVIYTFDPDPDGPPTELIAIFCDDRESEGQDCDWDVVASYNFPGVCLTLGSDRWHELRDLFKRIVERGGERVFRTVSAFLHELAQILSPEQVAEDILPVYRKCLELDDDVRERIFEHIDVLISRLPPTLGWQSFLRLSNSWKEDQLGGWRAREQLALHIPSFLETFREHDEVALVLDMMRSALLDKFAAVRDAATYAIPKTYDIVQRSHCSATNFYDMLLEFSHSPRYRQRLT